MDECLLKNPICHRLYDNSLSLSWLGILSYWRYDFYRYNGLAVINPSIAAIKSPTSSYS
jgi:hypothetical protein